MTEKIPKFTPEEIDSAWQAAQDANITFDTFQRKHQELISAGRSKNLEFPDKDITDEDIAYLYNQRKKTEANHNKLADMASRVMLDPDSPFRV